MPTVAVLEGMKIQFYADEHPPSHFHVVIGGYKAQIEISTLRILKGSLPPAKHRLIVSWGRDRRDKLDAAWASMLHKQKPEKIR